MSASQYLLSVPVALSKSSVRELVLGRAGDTLDERTRVVLLGTGTPNCEPGSSGSCIAVLVDDRPYLFDAGPGLVRKAAESYKMGMKGLELRNLHRVFITHLHSDHTTGLPDLLLSPWVLGRKEALKVTGPPGTKSMMEHLHKAYELDIKVRTEGPERANKTGHLFDVKEISEGHVYSDDLISVKAFGVKHTSFKYAFGYRIATPDKRIGISGDCVPTEDLKNNYHDLDILIHEVYSTKGFESKSPGWKTYHTDAHTSSKELAEILKEVRPKLTVLYHQLLWGASPGDILKEISEIYDGEVHYGFDLEVF
jgi:ribonuclease BN (tRNA processing enzyme)